MRYSLLESDFVIRLRPPASGPAPRRHRLLGSTIYFIPLSEFGRMFMLQCCFWSPFSSHSLSPPSPKSSFNWPIFFGSMQKQRGRSRPRGRPRRRAFSFLHFVQVLCIFCLLICPAAAPACSDICRHSSLLVGCTSPNPPLPPPAEMPTLRPREGGRAGGHLPNLNLNASQNDGRPSVRPSSSLARHRRTAWQTNGEEARGDVHCHRLQGCRRLGYN